MHFCLFRQFLQMNMAAHILQILCKGELIRETLENVVGVFRDSRISLCISIKRHLTKPHNLWDSFNLLSRETLGFFYRKWISCCVYSAPCFLFSYSDRLSQLLSLLLHWRVKSWALRYIWCSAECFLLHWESILNLFFKLGHLFF